MAIPVVTTSTEENPQDDCCTQKVSKRSKKQLHHRRYLSIDRGNNIDDDDDDDDDDYTSTFPSKRPLKHRKSSKRSKRHHHHHHSHHHRHRRHNNKNKPNRTLLYLRHRLDANTCSLACISVILIILTVHRLLSVYMTHRKWINAPITYMERTCPAPPYQTLLSQQQQHQQQLISSTSSSTTSTSSSSTLNSTTSFSNQQQQQQASGNHHHHYHSPRICITTLTDAKSPSRFQRFLRWRNFDGILELTWKNKLDYAVKHNYEIYDGSDLLDPTRPPAWTKIKAVQHLLSKQLPLEEKDEEEDNANGHGGVGDGNVDNNNKKKKNSKKNACDWVMWTDADTIIMNSDIAIESFLPAVDTTAAAATTTTATHDLLIGSDNGGGYNSGVFLFRNTAWSKQFLDTWWNMEEFVRPPGFSLSGDNHALKALLRDIPQFHNHVLSPARCTFNSFAQFLTLNESLTIMDRLEQQEWYLSENYYHRSDFLAHTPGYDNKEETLRLLLQEAR